MRRKPISYGRCGSVRHHGVGILLASSGSSTGFSGGCLRRLVVVCVVAAGFSSPSGEARAAEEPQVVAVEGFPVTIQFETGNEKVADKVAAVCRGVIPELSRQLGLGGIDPIRVWLIDDIAAFQRAQGLQLPGWGVAFAFVDNRIMVVDVEKATSAWNRLEQVVAHELSHLLLGQRAKSGVLPVWFIEGVALWQAEEWSLLDNWRLMESVWTDRAPPLVSLSGGLPAGEARARGAYRVAYTAVVDRFDGDRERLPEFLSVLGSTGDFGAAFELFFGESVFAYYARFDEALQKKYRSRLLVFQTGPLFSVMAVLFLFIFFRVRMRNRRTLEHWDRVDKGFSVDE